MGCGYGNFKSKGRKFVLRIKASEETMKTSQTLAAGTAVATEERGKRLGSSAQKSGCFWYSPRKKSKKKSKEILGVVNDFGSDELVLDFGSLDG
ncbi:hypothetical protein RJT34_30260 [Clitoria ternatea]|uniref:Uncharacterized protein n=1 Tax=Clitoria ternatea TaxID=43366 RepID=A0AAN9ET34_CLITE